MPSCLCQYFIRDKRKLIFSTKNKSNQSSNSLFVSRSASSVDTNSITGSSRISASEIATLRTEIWSLQTSLADQSICCENLQDVLTNVVQEKYELIEELNTVNTFNETLQNTMTIDRESHTTKCQDLITEIDLLKGHLNDRNILIEEINNENAELKMELYKANERIYKMSLMYLKLKNSKVNVDNSVVN